MATSGSFNGNSLTIGGRGSQYYFTNWQLAGQNIGGNYSAINWQTYFHFNGADAQLDNGQTNTTVGYVWNNGGRVYNYAGNFTTRNLGLASGSFNIGHDGAGNQTLSISGGISAYQSGRSSGGSSWSLPTIPRYAYIDGFNIDWVTDESIRIAWHSDSNVDYISWWSPQIDGGAHHDQTASGKGWVAQEFYGLPSGKFYQFYVAVRRADSNLWTTSDIRTATTLLQNRFFDVGDY